MALTKEERAEKEKKFKETVLSPQFIDDQLTEEGIAKSAQVLETIIDLKIHNKVFVSPFRRTLVSACELLKGHPRKSELSLVIDPMCMEHLGHKNLFLLHMRAMRRFCGKLEAQYGLRIDCSFLESFEDPNLWFLDMIPDQQVRNTIKEIANGASTLDEGGEEFPDYDMGAFEQIR